jgi:hypothetical protein
MLFYFVVNSTALLISSFSPLPSSFPLSFPSQLSSPSLFRIGNALDLLPPRTASKDAEEQEQADVRNEIYGVIL